MLALTGNFSAGKFGEFVAKLILMEKFGEPFHPQNKNYLYSKTRVYH